MATIRYINEQYTYLNRAMALTGSGGKSARAVLDVMDQQGVSDFLKEWPTIPCSHALKHRVRRTTNRPATTHRNLYQGVTPNISKTQVVWENVVLFEQKNVIDEDEFAGMDPADAKAERRLQVDGHIVALQEDYVYSIFNEAKSSGSEYIDGIAARLATLSYPGYTTTTLPYVFDGGGSGSDLCSMYVLELGPRALYGLMPGAQTQEGKNLGVIYRNKGLEHKGDSDDTTKEFYAYVDQFKLWAGVGCADDRKIIRIANIESDVASDYSFNENKLIEALAFGHFDKRSTRIYVGPRLYTQLCIKAKDKMNQSLDWDMLFGQKVLTIWGLPVRVLDQTILGESESAIT